MGTRTEYEPGTFSWEELSTPDADGAKRFYRELFGWQTEAASATATQDGAAVAAISEQPERQRSAGVRPHWLSYVTVATVDDAAARVDGLGGSLHAGPFDVADPTGAMLGIWEARNAIGAERVNDPGCLTSIELGPGEASVPPNRVPYFTVTSIDDALSRAGELGGGTLVGATQISAGRFAALRDPQGAAFSVFEGPDDD